MRSWKALLVAGMLIAPNVGASVASADTPSVPSATQTVVDAAYSEWYGSLGVRQDCSSGVSIVFEELAGRRGEYRTGSAEVVIDPTDNNDGMGAIVLHELSHHSFLACGVFADAEFTRAFFAAQGLPSERDWFDYSSGWAHTPVEQFAEALAVTIGGSSEGGVSISAETVTLVSRWLAGAPVVQAAETYEPTPYAAVGGSTALIQPENGSDEAAVTVVAPSPQAEIASATDVPQEEADDVVEQKPHTSVYRLISSRVVMPV
jgi:hypothetical protein